MSDTRTSLNNLNITTQVSNDTDEIMASYLKCLENILTEDEEYSTIVKNNYVRKGETND